MLILVSLGYPIVLLQVIAVQRSSTHNAIKTMADGGRTEKKRKSKLNEVNNNKAHKSELNIEY